MGGILWVRERLSPLSRRGESNTLDEATQAGEANRTLALCILTDRKVKDGCCFGVWPGVREVLHLLYLSPMPLHLTSEFLLLSQSLALPSQRI